VILLVLGIGFFLSYLSVIIRDVPNLVLIILQMWFFVTPVIYPADMIPQKYRFAMQLNPLFPLVNACRDVMLYDRMPDLATLVYPTLLALGVLYMGYIFFKVNEDRLADYQ
jgi:lipopolysaccharide transport system permease protein